MLVRPRLDPAGRQDPGVGVAVDGDPGVDVDGDAADRVDHLLEAREVDQHVVVDVDAEAAADRLLDRVGALVGARAEDPWVEHRDLAVDRVEHVGRRVAVAGEAGRVEVVERAGLGELGVHHVARQAEHHRLAGRGVDADQDQGVGAHPLAALSPVAAQQQHVDPVTTSPGVLLGDVGGHRRGLVVGEDGLDQVGLDPGVLGGHDEGGTDDAHQRQHEGVPRPRRPARPCERAGLAVGEVDGDRPGGEDADDHPHGDLETGGVEHQVERGPQVAPGVPGAEAGDRQGGDQDERSEQASTRPHEAAAGHHRTHERDAEGSREPGSPTWTATDRPVAGRPVDRPLGEVADTSPLGAAAALRVAHHGTVAAPPRRRWEVRPWADLPGRAGGARTHDPRIMSPLL